MSEIVEEVKEKKKKKVSSKSKEPKTPKTDTIIEKKEEVEIVDSPKEIEDEKITSSVSIPEEVKLPKIPEYKEPYEVPKAVKKGNVEALQDIDEHKLIELQEAFTLFDLNNDGFIDACDLRATFLTLGQDIPDPQIQQMMSEGLANPLDFDSFVVLLGYRSIELDPEDVLLEALSKWDKDGKGLINEDLIRHDLMSYGDKFTAKEANIALEEAPIAKNTGSGFNCSGPVMIDYPAFCKTLCGLRKRVKK